MDDFGLGKCSHNVFMEGLADSRVVCCVRLLVFWVYGWAHVALVPVCVNSSLMLFCLPVNR